MVSDEMLAKFKSLYLKKYNVVLTNEEATQMANDLVNLMSILLEPSPTKAQDKQNIAERRIDETLTTRSY